MLTANADSHLQKNEKKKIGCENKTDKITCTTTTGNTVIGNLLDRNMMLIPIAIDPFGRFGPLLQTFLYDTQPTNPNLITNKQSLIICFVQKTLRAVIDCMQKLFKCFETNQDEWRAVNGDGLKLLAVKDLERYRKKFPNVEDIQEDWSAVIRLPGKYVNLLVEQRTDEDLRKEKNEENYYDDEEWDQVHTNYFLAYHQAKARAHWCASRPDEVEHLNRFQVRT